MMDEVKRYFRQNTEKSFQQIDDSLEEDLNLEDLFIALNHTISSVGQQYLYNLLRNIPLKNNVGENEDWLSEYAQNNDLRKKVEKLLTKLSHADAYFICSFFQLEHPTISSKKMFFFRICQFAPLVSLLIFLFLHLKIAILFTLFFFVVNMAVHYKNKQISFMYAGAVPQLLEMIFVAEKLSKLVHLKNINMADALKQMKKLKSSFSLFRFEARMNSENAAIAWLISELFRVFFLLEPITLYKAFDSVRDKKEEIEKVFEFVGLVDVLQSVYKLRLHIPDYCIPQYVAEPKLSAKSIYHPLIDDCVKNTFSLDSKSFLIMGSNMSGKTTFMRTVAINTLVAQTLNTCFAESFCLQKQKIWSAISLSDSLTEGVSYYLAEVLRVRNILEQSSAGANLIVIDELFKGTNAEERIAMSKAVLSYLVKNENNTVLISTHDIEFADLIDTNKLELIHFKEKIEDNILSFSYLIQSGKSTSKNAIKLLEIYDYPPEIIDDAQAYKRLKR